MELFISLEGFSALKEPPSGQKSLNPTTLSAENPGSARGRRLGVNLSDALAHDSGRQRHDAHQPAHSLVHAPAICRVVTFRRFQVLISAIWMTREASAGSS